MLLVLLATFGGFLGFYVLLPVVPLFVTHGGAGGFGAGLVTTALMASTVAIQPLAARLPTWTGRSCPAAWQW